jgi:hypothetical protein
MNRLISGLAALPLLVGAASAQESARLTSQQPVRLTNQQMDKVNGGFLEVEVSNTSTTVLSLFQRSTLTEPTDNFVACSNCFLVINSPTFAFAASFGPGATFTVPRE